MTRIASPRLAWLPALGALISALALVACGAGATPAAPTPVPAPAPAPAIDPALYVSIETGTLPVVLSAPHGGRTTVPGVPAR